MSSLRPLTDKQVIFVEHVVNGVPATEAAKLAGYAHPAQLSYQLRQNPAVLKAIHAGTTERLVTAAGGALAVLVEIAHDAEAPKGVRVDAAKAILDRAGHTARVSAAESIDARSLTEMTGDELREFIARGEAKLAAMAKPVGPSAPLEEPEDCDMME